MNNKKLHAMILAAGMGSRMRPITDTIPKPLVTVAGRTLIDHTLDWCSASSVNQVTINSFYKAELLEAHIEARQLLHPGKPEITVVREQELLETGGGIKNALPYLGSEPFLSANSDSICIDAGVPAIERLLAAWDDRHMDALLLVHPVIDAIGYDGKGDFFVADGGVIRRRHNAPSAPFVFTGVQLLHPRLFEGAPQGAFSLNVLYNRGMTEDGVLPRVRALIHDGQWLHVGDPQELAQAEDWFSQDHVISV